MAPNDENAVADIPVGVSSCLLGSEVRHDGGHRRSRYVVDVLGRWFRYVPVCPEVGVGMGTPRPAVRLVEGPDGPRLIAPRADRDWTDEMRRWTARRLDRLATHRLRGFIVKSRSPSCGLERVKIYGAGGRAVDHGPGLFTQALVERFPLLPVEDEGRLNDARLRESFVVRVFLYDDWLKCREAARPADLVAFHTRHKMLILAHDPERYAALGRMVARAGRDALEPLLDAYGETLMAAFARPASPKRQINAMRHLVGFVKTHLDRDDKTEFDGLIEDYRAGRVPLAVPMTLLKHFVRRWGNAWARSQSFLEPHPRDLGLRSRV